MANDVTRSSKLLCNTGFRDRNFKSQNIIVIISILDMNRIELISIDPKISHSKGTSVTCII